jgi:hypothetical protein
MEIFAWYVERSYWPNNDKTSQITSDKVTRRLDFYPHDDSCEDHIGVQLKDVYLSLNLAVDWQTTCNYLSEKLTACDEVYDIKPRVEGG